jgi:hypothetical protein
LKNTDTDYKSFETSLKFMPTLGNNNELIPCNMFIGGNIDLYPIVLCKQWDATDSKWKIIWA